MKTIPLLLFFYLTLALFSCKKPGLVENPALYGKWLLVEYYDANEAKAIHQWAAVPSQYSHTLQFSPSGNFEKVIAEDNRTCEGQYALIAAASLSTFTTCQLVQETMNISFLDQGILILNRSTGGGTIRYKYKSIQ